MTPNPPTCSAPRVPASSTTSLQRPPRGPPSRSTHCAGPGVLSLPAGRQPAHRPCTPGAASTPGSPNARSAWVPPRLSIRPSPVTIPAPQRGDLLAAAARRGRGARGAGPESSESPAPREPAIGSKPRPRREPRPGQPVAEPSSAHSGRRDCSTAERAMEDSVA